MFGNREIQAKIREHERRLREEEANYINALKARSNYETLRAIRSNIREIKEELQTLYLMRGPQM